MTFSLNNHKNELLLGAHYIFRNTMEFKHENSSNSTHLMASNKETLRMPNEGQESKSKLTITNGDLLCLAVNDNWLLGFTESTANKLMLYAVSSVINTVLWPCIFQCKCELVPANGSSDLSNSKFEFSLVHEETGLHLASLHNTKVQN